MPDTLTPSVLSSVKTTATVTSGAVSGVTKADITASSSLSEVRSSLESTRTKLQQLNRRYDSTNSANYGRQNSAESQAVAKQLDELHVEFQRLSAIERQKEERPATLADTRVLLDETRNKLQQLNARMDAYDIANPGRQNSAESQAMEQEYMSLRSRFDQLSGVERGQEAVAEQLNTTTTGPDGLSSTRTSGSGGDKLSQPTRSQSRTIVASNTPSKGPSANTSSYLPAGVNSVAGMPASSGRNPNQLSPSNPNPSASFSGGPGGPNTTTAGSDGMPETQTDSKADSMQPARFDYVDIMIYTGFALMIDGVGLIPVVGEIVSPLGIAGFKLFFWLKGVNPRGSNVVMAALGGSEFIPFVSELLPGCTAYVLTVAVMQNLDKVGDAARMVAKVAPAPQVKAVAAGVAAATDVAQGEDAKSAVAKEASGAMSGGAGGAAAAGGAAGAASSASGAAEAGATSTGGAGGGNDFRGNFDFGSVSKDSADAAQAGDKKDEERPGDPAKSGKTPYAQGSPLVEGQPYADAKKSERRGGVSAGLEDQRQAARDKQRDIQQKIFSLRKAGNYEEANRVKKGEYDQNEQSLKELHNRID